MKQWPQIFKIDDNFYYKKHFNGDICYFDKNDRLHRKDGPAVILFNSDIQWWENGKVHRIDGPAIEYVNGFKAWYYQGERINCNSQSEFERIIRLKCLW